MTDQLTFKIGLPWHSSNSSNLGLAALTQCELELLDDAAATLGLEPRFEVLFWPDRTEANVHHPRMSFVPFSKEFLLSPVNGMLAFARRMDMVVDIAGGDSFTDQYGSRRFLFQALSKAVVVLSGTPLILAPQTVGPFEHGWSRRLAGWVLRRARAVVTRDSESSEVVRALGAEARLLEATDVAFRLPHTPVALPRSKRVRVGLNVSGLLYEGGYSRANYFGLSINYAALIDALLSRLTLRGDCDVHLVSHVVVPRRFETIEDDHRVALRLAAAHEGVVAAPAFATPFEAKSYIAAMDVFAGSRMHACIAAFSAGVPVIPLAYSRKFRGLFSTLGYTHVADCRAETPEQIIDRVERGIDERYALKAQIGAAAIDVNARLASYEALLRKCMAEALGHSKPAPPAATSSERISSTATPERRRSVMPFRAGRSR